MATLSQFKRWARTAAPLASAVLAAQAFAELKREQVDAYVRPIFDRYAFQYRGDLAEKLKLSGPLPSPKELYLCDDEPGLKAFYADCDDAHRAHGFTGPAGHCPALVAENLLMEARRALIEQAEPMLGVSDCQLYGDTRREYIDLLMGACVKTGLVTNMFQEAPRG